MVYNHTIYKGDAMTRTDIKIDSKIADRLRELAFKKHGTFRGSMKEEAEQAILNHIRREGVDWTPSH